VDCHLESTTAHAALQNSAIALKQAKSLARSKCLYFESSQSQAAKERLLLLNDLRTSFLAERLFLVYQPFVELSTGATLGAEALLRWKNDQGDYVAPDRFIPLAEESGLIVPLGQWIMRVAFREHGRLKAAARGPFRIAINVSHIQFREPDFVDSLERAMADCGTDPRDVEIELTESVAIEDLDHIVKTLERIRALGVSISVDDFGTGYSSLSVIRRLPVQRLKIDRAFVGTLQTDPSIASLVIGLARQLGLETIAEGVETPEQLGSLQELLCQEGQGYFFAKPMQAEDMLAYLTRSAMRH
jgi:EAL domain-containing protein (putative c-di-GMP-specific phosphodiesterase class I)